MKENTLLGNWTGSGELVAETIKKHAEWEKRSSRRWICVFLTLTLLAVTLMLVAEPDMQVSLFVVFTAIITVVLGGILSIIYKPLRYEEPDMTYVNKYREGRNRLAKALGIDPERLESMDYDPLRYGVVLPTLDGLTAKLRAQAEYDYFGSAARTYNELKALHGACPPFRFLDGTGSRYVLEPFESYVRPSVPA